MTTPYMSLELPDVSLTVGPTWAQMLNEALEAIDAHTHAAGDGAPLTQDSISITASFSLNGNSLAQVTSVLFSSLDSDISDTNGTYVKNGEFFFKDASGNVVQITSGGSIVGTSGSFTGLSSPAAATYSSANKLFIWTYDSSKHARMANGDIQLFPYNGSTAYTKSVTIKAPTAIEAASSYSLTLPSAVPGATEYLSIDTSGNLNHATLSGTANQISVSASATAITLSLPTTVSTATYQAGSGSAASPTYTFASDTDVGIYRSSTNVLGFSTAGTERLLIGLASITASNPIRGVSGSVTAPTYTFSADTNTGIYQPATDTLSIAADGIQVVTVSTTAVDVNGIITADDVTVTGDTISGTVFVGDGAAATPSISFTSDDNTGIYRPASNSIGFTTGGSVRATISDVSALFAVPVVTSGDITAGDDLVATDDIFAGGSAEIAGVVTVGDGSASIPSVSFISDPNTGFYNRANNEIGVTAAGSLTAVFASDGLRFSSSGTGFKAQLFTATSSSASVTLTPTSSGTVLVIGAIGFTTITSGSWTGMETLTVGGDIPTSGWHIAGSTTGADIELINTDIGFSRSYRVLVFYTET